MRVYIHTFVISAGDRWSLDPMAGPQLLMFKDPSWGSSQKPLQRTVDNIHRKDGPITEND
jgi:hypothetical protein